MFLAIIFLAIIFLTLIFLTLSFLAQSFSMSEVLPLPLALIHLLAILSALSRPRYLTFQSWFQLIVQLSTYCCNARLIVNLSRFSLTSRYNGEVRHVECESNIEKPKTGDNAAEGLPKSMVRLSYW